ncbi:unannotated protein [freshwater metagenome]|uniref:Unannotated protein n=2 Tax=freshwater metagenome TaxID=449393 RepID=A0A6J6W6I6_9ZZZZ
MTKGLESAMHRQATKPLVRVVVVDYDGGETTLACLRSLEATNWPEDSLEIVLVDNASQKPVTALVRSELPRIRVIESSENLGFGGGCNLGIGDLTGVDYVALINNDMTVEPEWLSPLVDAVNKGPRIGASSPKIILASRYRKIRLRSDVSTHGRGDKRTLGIRIDAARVGGVDVTSDIRYISGTWGPELQSDGSLSVWTNGLAELLIPFSEEDTEECELLLSSLGPVEVSIEEDGAETGRASATISARPQWISIQATRPTIEVIQNTGTEIIADGFGVDRGYLDIDNGLDDLPGEIPVWCGGAVLLKSEYLRASGRFDSSLFLYYEDVDLSLRGSTLGWRYVYEPASVVHHIHAATASRNWRRSEQLKERNRLVVLRRHAGLVAGTKAWINTAGATAGYAKRDIVSPMLHGEKPRPAYVAARLRALSSAAASFLSSR